MHYLLFINDLEVARLVIAVLALLLLIVCYILIRKNVKTKIDNGASRFLEVHTNKQAKEVIHRHRGNEPLSNITTAILYKKETIENYLTNIFPSLTKKMVGANDHKWVVGFYPMQRKNDKGEYGIDFLVIPTPAKFIIDENSGQEKIVSYHDFYNTVTGPSVETPYGQINNPTVPVDKIAYNSGHMYPYIDIPES
jgi:uncharacterized membrane protein YecN with MAPEG domain